MSTAYYYLKAPITSIRAEKLGGHTHIGVWINHGKAGTLVVRNEEVAALLTALADTDADDSTCPIHTYFGGKDKGRIVTENVRGLDPELVLIDEYGQPHTVASIRTGASE